MIIFQDSTILDALMRPVGTLLLAIVIATVVSGFVSEIRDRRRMAAQQLEPADGRV